MLLQTAKIISPPNQDCWPQIYLENGLILIVKAKSASPVLARTIVGRFNESYQNYSQEKTLPRLEKSLKIIQVEFGQTRPEIITAVFLDKALYLGILNQGRLALLREGKLAMILAGQPDSLQTASGFLKENDVFVLATESLFRLLNKDELQQKIADNSLEKIAETNTGIAGVIITLKAQSASWRTKISKACFFTGSKIKLPSWPRAWRLPRQQKSRTRQQRMMLTVAIILAGLLLTSVVFGWQKKRKAKIEAEFQELWNKIDYQYQEGKELIEINPVLARKMLQESLNLTREKKETYVAKSRQYQQLVERENEVQHELEKVLREYQLSEAPVFLDLGLIKSGLKAIDFGFWQEKMIVLGEDGTVLTIDFNKKTEILGKIQDGRQVAFWGNRAFVLGKESLVEVGQADQAVENDWQEVIDLQAFSANLYLLDKGQNQILKLAAIENGFGSSQEWLSREDSLDFGSAQAMAIDGDVWVLLTGGQLLKFTRGAPKAFGLSGLPAGSPEMSETAAFYTDDNLQKIYLLDKSNSRIVVFSKNGEYDSQYLWPGMKDISRIVVSEKEKKMLLLSGSKIYELEIRNK